MIILSRTTSLHYNQVLIFIFLLLPKYLLAQCSLEGKIVDQNNKEALSYTTVTLISYPDTTKPLGALTDENGIFTFQNIPKGLYGLKINLLGYEPVYVKQISIEKHYVKLPNFYLKPDIKQLDAIEVIGEKQDLTLQIDKKVYEMDKNLVAVGGTALDAISQIPSVTTDMDGNIQVRGNGNLQVWINGKPSAITGASRQAVLDQIPASSIERVELITNPSSRYDAEGSAGILNIILKKNRSDGVNGNAAFGIGTRQSRLGQFDFDPYGAQQTYFDVNKYNSSSSLNMKKGKFNMSTNIGYRENPNWYSIYNYRKNRSANTEFEQYENGESRINTSSYGSLSLDFQPNDKNILTLDLVGGWSEAKEVRTLHYDFFNLNNNSHSYRLRTTDNPRYARNADFGLSWRKTFSTKGREFYASSNISGRESINPNYFYQADFADAQFLDPITGTRYQNSRNINSTPSQIWVSQIDYNTPVNEKLSIELGAKINRNTFSNPLTYDTLDNTNNWRTYDLLSSSLQFEEQTGAIYATGKYKLSDIWAIQSGIRTEYTKATVQSKNTESGYEIQRPFPSIYIIRKSKNGNEFKISYSRRINRPDFRALNTVPIYTDPLNLYVGNAAIKPEDIHAHELSYLTLLSRLSITNTLFYRHTLNPMTRYRTVDPVSNVFVLSIYNLDFEQNIGHELVMRYEFFKWWNATLSTNITAVRQVGQLFNVAIDNRNYTGNVRIVSNFKIWKGADLQINGNYMAPRIMPQGTFQAWNGVDIGYKQELVPKKAFININIGDVFNSRAVVVRMDTPDLKANMVRKHESRVVYATLTYKFGKELKLNPKKSKPGNENVGSGGGID